MSLRDFNKDAANWDKDPARVKLASDIARALIAQVKLRHDMDVLDFGCGTGMMTVFLAPFVRNVTAVDSAQGMLEVLNKKIIERKINNIKTLYWDITQRQNLPGKYNLIISSMALHHIEDLSGAINTFYDHLLPKGILAVADLDSDGGEFHDDKTGVFHNGFGREQIRAEFKRAGFNDVVVEPAALINRPVNGVIKRFTVFLAVGKK